MIYIMLGGPATGKGTISSRLSEKFNIPHISTGDILREVSKTNDKIKNILLKGELISDDIINDLLYKRLCEDDCKNGFILDGYPRKIEQAYSLDKMLERLNYKISHVIELVTPREILFERILGRKTCPKCKRAYGISFKSKDDIHCDDCGAVLETRSDDTKETLTIRLDTYEKNIKPIEEYYRNNHSLNVIDSSGNIDDVVKSIESVK